MRLLVVTHNYPRFPGDPAGAFVARLAEATARRADVRVVTPRVPAAQDVAGPVAVERFRYAPRALERVGYRGDPLRLAAPTTALVLPAYLFAFRRAVRRAAAEFSPAVIHAHWWLPAGWLVRHVRVPYIVTCHGTDVRLLRRVKPLRPIARQVLAGAAAVTTVSQFLADELRTLLGGAVRPVVLRMPLDVERFRSATAAKAQPPTILYAGNLVPQKGVDVLLRAVARLRDWGIACRTRVLGEGPARDRLQRLAKDLSIADRIEWSGFVGQDRMPQEYGASTITVLPSRGGAEGLGLVLVEALLAGCAVVGTAVGGIPEVVEHERTGLLARDGDVGDLAEQLRRLLLDADLRGRVTEQGRARALAQFATDAVAQRFLELYADVVHRHANG